MAARGHHRRARARHHGARAGALHPLIASITESCSDHRCLLALSREDIDALTKSLESCDLRQAGFPPLCTVYGKLGSDFATDPQPEAAPATAAAAWIIETSADPPSNESLGLAPRQGTSLHDRQDQAGGPTRALGPSAQPWPALSAGLPSDLHGSESWRREEALNVLGGGRSGLEKKRAGFRVRV